MILHEHIVQSNWRTLIWSDLYTGTQPMYNNTCTVNSSDLLFLQLFDILLNKLKVLRLW